MRRRPASITVFAVLNMVFGGLGLLSPLVSLSMKRFSEGPMMEMMENHSFLGPWQTGGVVLAVLVSLALIYIGVALLSLKPWARTACVVYAVYGVIMTLAQAAVSWLVMKPALIQIKDEMPMGDFVVASSMAGVILGLIFGMAYPLVIGIFMSRNKVKEIFEPRQSERVELFD